MLRGLIVSMIACCLWNGVLRAQPATDRDAPPPPLPSYCVPRYAEQLQGWRHWFNIQGDWLAKQRAAEGSVIGENPDVFRYQDRLYLALDDTTLAVLTDCPVGDGMYRYFYQGYDSVGHSYVVRIGEYEDGYYALLSKHTGLLLRVFSLPLWSPNKEYFVHGRCQAMNGPDRMWIVRPVNEGFLTEATVELPCSGECNFVWESSTVLLAKCAGSNGWTTVRVVRDGEKWKVEAK